MLAVRAFNKLKTIKMKFTPLEKAWVLMCRINDAFISKQDWEKASEYAKNDLKRKCLIVVDEVLENLEPLCISHLGTYTNPKIEYWQTIKELIVAL
jgi:hypothetical protein